MSETALILAIIDLVITQGPRIAIQMMKTLNVEDPTPEDIRTLKVPDPESYFQTAPEDGGL